MADDVYTKDQAAQLVFNAEIKKDISAIKETLTTMNKNVETYAGQFIPRVEVMEWKTAADKMHEGFDKRLRFLERYAWAAIGIIGLLELIAQFAPLLHISLS